MNQIDESGVKNLVQFNLPILLSANLLDDDSITLSIGCPALNISPKLLIAARGNVRKFKTLDALYSTCKRIGVNEFPLTIKA